MQDQEKTQDQAEQTAQMPEGKASEGGAQNGAQTPNEVSVEQRLATAESRATEMQDAYLRAKAETENIRRRAQDDIAKAHKFAIENFAEALVPVKDSLEMALKLDTPSVDSLKEGVEMTLKQLSAAFERNRLMEINPQPGEKLDPMKHQAISIVPSDQEANTVVSVLQKGYLIADRLLRPALVTVAQ
jgi:molecular chaperone GrpE